MVILHFSENLFDYSLELPRLWKYVKISAQTKYFSQSYDNEI